MRNLTNHTVLNK